MLFFIAAGVLLASVALIRQLMNSRYGELLVAVRDQEERVRFLGYDPANIKLVAYVTAAFLAGIAGALFVPIVGIISPADVGIVPSIAFLIGVAIGGRATLLGPVLGAIGRRMGTVDILGETPFGMDLRTRVDVHRRGRVLPGRCGRIVRPDAPPQEA